MTEITPETLAERLAEGDPDVLPLDIRPTDVFEDWHVPGSKQIDVYDDLKNDPEAAAERLDTLPAEKEIVTVCGVGKVSAQATELLSEMGYDAKTLVDGMRGWGRVHRATALPVESLRLVQVARPGTGCLSYVLISGDRAMVVDPSQYIAVYEGLLEDYGAKLAAVLETHAHADHVSGALELADRHKVPYYLHPADSGSLDRTTDIVDQEELTLGSTPINVIHTPGHTAGSVTFNVTDEALLTGDTLFIDSVGRPDLEAGDQDATREQAESLHESLRRVLELPDEALVLPAHAPGTPEPPVTAPLGAIRERNDMVGRDQPSFVDSITADVPEKPPNHERIKRSNVGRLELSDTDARQLELGPNQCAAG